MFEVWIQQSVMYCGKVLLSGPPTTSGAPVTRLIPSRTVVLCAADIDGPLHTACTAPAEERPASAACRAGDG